MTSDALPLNHSTLVTVVGWVLIAVSGLMSAIGIGQMILVVAMFGTVQPDQIPEGTSAIIRFMLQHSYQVFATFLFMSVLVLVIAIQLLRRLEWARRMVVFILSFGAIYMIGVSVVALNTSLAPPIPEGATPEFQDIVRDIESTMRYFRVFTVLFSIGWAGLLAWIVWKLSTGEIREEF